ncbi:hypothetical protein N6G95_09635 [Pediococcus inopinatus]|uniref:hypothetical protein n=1 Tax=Pediococcus inopinatus TaxID=114090 RepID=UPI002B2625CA|nr:hypothetical protein [Pediococcus inopinatus]WPC19464.1 hypothetical protein N6G95_09635 [Pediococcus inopinatus]
MVMKNLKNSNILIHMANLASATLNHRDDCECRLCQDLRASRTEMEIVETKDLKEKVINLLKLGYAHKNVAETLGVTTHDVNTVLRGKTLNHYGKTKPHVKTIDRRKRVSKYADAGLSIEEIAEMEDCTLPVIKDDLYCLGIHIEQKTI